MNSLDELSGLVEELYWPTAERFDRADLIAADRFDPLADLGLFAMAVPDEAGGAGFDPVDVRRVLRTLSSGCGATAFMFAQHHGAAYSIATSENANVRNTWADKVTSRTLAGTTYGHVRRAKQPVVGATPGGDGRWILSGEAPWATSWGVAAVYTIAAVTPDDELIWAVVDPSMPGVFCPAPLDLMVFGQTGTVRMAFDGFVVDESNLARIEPLDAWRVRDAHVVSRPSPLALGVGDRAIRLLEEAAPSVAAPHRREWDEVSHRADEASASVDRNESDVAEVAAARAEVIVTVQRLTTVLLSVLGGRAAELSQPAQRLAREALFYVVQGQADDGRAALLRATDPA